MSDIESLPLLLKQLNLSGIKEHWQTDASAAERENLSYGQYLAGLCNKELSLRKQRRIERLIKTSKLPPAKTLDSFNFKEIQSINPAQITSLSTNADWIRQAHNLIIFGPSGVGKTHLASAIAYRLIEQGIRVLFSQTTTLVQQLQKAHNQYCLPEAIAKLSRIDLLILDDIGYVKRTEAETNVLFELIAARYESQSMIITSNQPFSQWDQIFTDSVMAVAAIDRLVHHATIINAEGESYRKNKTINL